MISTALKKASNMCCSSPNSHERIKIIIVDDDPVISKIILSILRGKGFQCRHAFNIGETIDVLATNYLPDLVISDLHIGDESGCDVLKHFRAHSRFRSLPVLLISTDEAGHDIAVENGFNAFLHKTYIFSDLVKTVYRLAEDLNAD